MSPDCSNASLCSLVLARSVNEFATRHLALDGDHLERQVARSARSLRALRSLIRSLWSEHKQIQHTTICWLSSTHSHTHTLTPTYTHARLLRRLLLFSRFDFVKLRHKHKNLISVVSFPRAPCGEHCLAQWVELSDKVCNGLEILLHLES